ncbi:MAG: hypothetical protein A2Z20_02125 [Bdellovibrionales bacterium RBG_16_40_8]|nr:MAG: hypothetical protein A2Z20_02125 [Bdellovibrionales bacterium RBG_16_40_8]
MRLVHFYFFTFCFSLAFIYSQLSLAGQAPDYSIHQEYTSTRALGMGNAFVALADDHSALFYNPAGMALRKDTHLRMLLRGGADADVMSFKQDVDDAGDDPDKMNTALEKHYGEHMYFRAPTLGGVLVRPKWGLAIIPVDFSLDLTLHRSVGPSVFVNAYLDTTVAYGHASLWRVSWLKNKLAFGWTAKVIHRLHYSDIVQAAQLATDDDIVNIDRSAEGVTLDGDIGFLYARKKGENKWYHPSIGLVVRNVFDYGFPVNFGIYNKDPKEPPRLQRRLDLGTKFDLPEFWVFDPKFTFDIRDIGHRNWTFKKGLHAGSELYWKMASWWKGHWAVGINQGYLTAGFGARMGIFQLDLASWGEEVGTSEASRESRRYILEASLDF